MKCTKCEFENTPDSKFCKECGTKLDPTLRKGTADDVAILHTKTLETPVEELTRGTLFAGRYEIIEELGRGGMGAVCKAEKMNLT